MFSLILAITFTFCNESLGLIHTNSLRWALSQEGRLEFNSNLRLLTHVHTSKPNHWAVNLYALFTTAIAYTAAGQILVPESFPDLPARERLFQPSQDPSLSFSLPALAVLTLGLSSQTMIATWSFLAMGRHVPTWSANPLNNALTCVHHGLEARPDRTLTSYDHSSNIQRARYRHQIPRRRQHSLADSRPSAILVTILLWVAVLVTIIWVSCTFGLGTQTQKLSQGTESSVLHRGNAVTWTANPSSSANFRWAVVLAGIAFVFATQLTFTFALHCVELLVNVTRDERVWRKASDHLKGGLRSGNGHSNGAQSGRIKKAKGANIDPNAIKEAFTSWETSTLFIFKIAIHWIFGESIQIKLDTEANAHVTIWARSLLLLMAFLFGVALFGTYLCFRKRNGPQPVAYGHLQTLVDLVDDWGKSDEKLYWGDKGHVSWDHNIEIRRAGTAGTSKGVGLVRIDARYR
ncbi:MAG: hypothetical protein L6R38_005820 [Xanthoria sp. 2 TBL-2021]|nr:MAG: hypothetical protein L6R38_005820 [Xanthoria sp. 2 TBL-2021]